MLANILKGASASTSTPPTVTWLQALDLASSTTVTFSSANFGTASSTRRIYVYAFWFINSGLERTVTCTIGGVSATAYTLSAGGNTSRYQVFAADVPTGTSGDVVLTFSGSIGSQRVSVGMWSVTNQTSSLASAEVDEASINDPSTRSASITLNTASNGFALIVALNNGSGQTVTYTNATLEATLLATRTYATVYPPTTGSSLTITSTQTSTNNLVLAGTSFNP